MIIERMCPIENVWNQMEIAVTQQQIDSWMAGELIQNAMPNLTPDQREFIKTGITPETWEKLFKDSM